MPPAAQQRSPRRTRGGYVATGTSANRRAKASAGVSAKGERTRASLIEAARRVFERDGYIDARVSDIVREAGIAHGSYYTYFDSKKAVFQAVADEVGREIDAAVGHSATDAVGAPLANLRNVNARYLEVQRKNSKILDLVEQVGTVDPEIQAQRIESRRRHVDRVAATITRLQQRGFAETDLNVHTAAGALVAMLASFAHWSSTCPDDYVAVEETVTAIWARAIGLKDTPPAEAARNSKRRFRLASSD